MPTQRRLDASGPADRKKIALGTKPIALRTFRCAAVQPRVFKASCFLSVCPGSIPECPALTPAHALPPLPRPPCRRSRGSAAVFAASDRPTIMYSANKKLLYSNLNENEVRGRRCGCC